MLQNDGKFHRGQSLARFHYVPLHQSNFMIANKFSFMQQRRIHGFCLFFFTVEKYDIESRTHLHRF